MIFNLLNVTNDLTNPANKPAGYGGINTDALWVVLLALIASVVTVVSNIIICRLCIKQSDKNNKIKIIVTTIIITIIILIIYNIITYFGYKAAY